MVCPSVAGASKGRSTCFVGRCVIDKMGRKRGAYRGSAHWERRTHTEQQSRDRIHPPTPRYERGKRTLCVLPPTSSPPPPHATPTNRGTQKMKRTLRDASVHCPSDPTLWLLPAAPVSSTPSPCGWMVHLSDKRVCMCVMQRRQGRESKGQQPPSLHQQKHTRQHNNNRRPYLSPRPGPGKLPCASTVAKTKGGRTLRFSTTSTPPSLLLEEAAAAADAGRFLPLLDALSASVGVL